MINETIKLNKEFERQIKSYCEKWNVEWDLLDYESLWDNKITEAENLIYIKSVIEDVSKNRIEKEFENKKRTIKNEKSEQKRLEIENIKREEQHTEQQFIKSLEELKKTDESIIKEYEIPKEYIKSIIKGYNKSFIFIGKTGLGKTYLTRQILVKEKAKFIENRGVNSPLALYQFLYENNKEDLILVFDDTSGLINNPNAYSVLLNVLWEGFAEWNSTSDKLKVPKKFQFVGKIIFITNKLNGENAEIFKSRCLVYDLQLKNKDIIKMMYLIAKQKHEKLKPQERIKMVDFIRENTNNSTENLDLRTLNKIENLYLYDKENWKNLSMPLFSKNNEMEYLMVCISSSNSVKEAQEKFCNETGKSRRSFYLYKQQIY